METLEHKIRGLEARLIRQRVVNGLMLCGLALVMLGGRAGPPDAEFGSITCREWRVVDSEGKLRIRAQAVDDGQSSLTWRDREGTVRIGAGTFDDGTAGVGWRDKNGKERVAIETLANGESTARWSDGSQKVRVGIGTWSSGRAAVEVLDAKSKIARLGLITDASGIGAIQVNDEQGVIRFGTALEPNGWIASTWYDAKARPRIRAGISPTQEVILPTDEVRDGPPRPPMPGAT